MTAKEIQFELCKFLAVSGIELICENISTPLCEIDVAAITRAGIFTDYEIKISKSDFKKDLSKVSKHSHYISHKREVFYQVPHYFYYVCPAGLIQSSELPKHAGLIYFSDGIFKWIVPAKRLHRDKIEVEKITNKMLRLHVQRKYIGSAMLTYKNKLINEQYNKTQTT